MQFVPPVIHLCFPVAESLRDYLREVCLITDEPLTNFPHEAPLSVEYWLKWRHWCILRSKLERFELLMVVTRLLNELWRCSNLIEAFGLDVINFFTCVEQFSSPFEVVFHQVDVLVVVFHVYSWVSDDQNAELVKAFSHFLAFNPGCSLSSLTFFLPRQEDIEINYWHVCKFFTDNFSAFAYMRHNCLSDVILFLYLTVFHLAIKS